MLMGHFTVYVRTAGFARPDMKVLLQVKTLEEEGKCEETWSSRPSQSIRSESRHVFVDFDSTTINNGLFLK